MSFNNAVDLDQLAGELAEIGIKKIYAGKVRELYQIDDKTMLMIASDRLSAFDVIMSEPIVGKGEILTAMSNFWFDKLAKVMPNHFVGKSVDDVLPPALADKIRGRAVICQKLTPLKIEAIVRGYLTGTGFNDYKKTGEICGHKLPKGLVESSKLPQAIFTPSSKAEFGSHDENISLDQCKQILGEELANLVEQKALQLYNQAAQFALTKGIIICDTKFEFGLDDAGNLLLMDEVLTPDSSRFWAVEDYQEGKVMPSFDKQFVRNYLLTLDWDKTPPAPAVPLDIIAKTKDKYLQALNLLTAP